MTTLEERVERITQELKERQIEYLEEVQEYHEQGYRAHYCIHGTNLWTDYDNICGGCEDGAFNEYSDEEEIRAYALILAEDEIFAEKRKQDLHNHLVFMAVEHGMSMNEAEEFVKEYERP